MAKIITLPHETFSCVGNVFWVFFHQMLSETKHRSVEKRAPVDSVHIKLEQVFIFFV